MLKRLALVSVFVAASPDTVAFAQEPQVVPCVGPMCMLTPIYRLGTMIPGLPAEPPRGDAPPPPTQPPSAAPTQAQVAPAQLQVAQPSTKDPSAAAPEGAVASGATPAAAPEATDDRGEAVPRKVRQRSSPAARRREARRPVVRLARSASRAARPPRDDAAGEAVTIAANGTEIERLLRLAAVVKAPPIRVVPAAAFVDGCRQKPADFVVDTMSNPNRVGPAIPLFTESLIILARKNVADLAGLRGRKVSFGLPGGSSQRVAERVFRALAVKVQEQPLDLDNALDGLALGDLDAVALLVPQSFDRFARHDPGLHLLPLPETMIPPDGLKLSRIDPSSYLGGTWPTPSLGVVTVDAVLSPSRAGQMQPNAQAVYAALGRRSSELAENGFDLIGGGGLTTRRSSARDASPPKAALMPAGSGC